MNVQHYRLVDLTSLFILVMEMFLLVFKSLLIKTIPNFHFIFSEIFEHVEYSRINIRTCLQILTRIMFKIATPVTIHSLNQRQYAKHKLQIIEKKTFLGLVVSLLGQTFMFASLKEIFLLAIKSLLIKEPQNWHTR